MGKDKSLKRGNGSVLGKGKGLRVGEGDDRVRSGGKGLGLGKWEDFRVGKKKEREKWKG